MGLLDTIGSWFSTAAPGDPSAATGTTPGLLDTDPNELLGPMPTRRQSALDALGQGLGGIGAAMAKQGTSGRPLGLGGVLGLAGAAFNEGVGDPRAERLKQIMERYVAADKIGDLKTKEAARRDYAQLAAMMNSTAGPGGNVAPSADAGAAMAVPGGTTQDPAGAFQISGTGAPQDAGGNDITQGAAAAADGGGAAPGAGGGTGDPMVTWKGETRPRSVWQAAVRLGQIDPTKAQEVLANYDLKMAEKGQYRTLSPDEVQQLGLSPGKGYQIDQQGKVSVIDTGTNITLAPTIAKEKAFNEGYGGGQGKLATKIVDAGQNAIGSVANYQLLEDANKAYERSGGVGTALQPYEQGLKSIWVGLGFGTQDQVANLSASEVFNALAGKQVLASMGGSLGAGFSEGDRKFVVGNSPSLTMTNYGRRKLIGIGKAVEYRNMYMADKWQSGEYDTSKEEEFGRFQKDMREYARSHSIVDEARALTPRSDAPVGSQDNPIDVTDPAEAEKLPVGTYFANPDGHVFKR